MKIAFFDAKSYDMPGFNRYIRDKDLEIKYFETHLNADTVSLAAGFDGKGGGEAGPGAGAGADGLGGDLRRREPAARQNEKKLTGIT